MIRSCLAGLLAIALTASACFAHLPVAEPLSTTDLLASSDTQVDPDTQLALGMTDSSWAIIPPVTALGADSLIDPSGLYFRASLMGVDPVSDATAKTTGFDVETDPGIGFSVAAGFKMPDTPLAWELEYMYRRFSYDTFIDPNEGRVVGGDVKLHTFAFNLLADQPNIIGPVGAYAGGGVGFRVSSFSYKSSAGSGAESSISGDGLFLQAMAGLTVSLDNNVQLYGGARYTDSGMTDNDSLDIDTAAVTGEIGLRIYY